MNLRLVSLFLFILAGARGATVANQFLLYVHGGDGVEVEKLVWPNDDVWMLRGAKNPEGLAELAKEEPVPHGANEIVWANINQGLCIVEVRDGKVDPRFMLDQVYVLHRQAILRFIYACLTQDKDEIRKFATDAAKVRFGRAKPAAQGDMDVYGEIVAMLPVVRTSLPAEDKKTRSVTYRLPLGKKGLSLKLTKKDSTWLIDTSAGLDVPLEFFFQ